jgi:hypothetical protein
MVVDIGFAFFTTARQQILYLPIDKRDGSWYKTHWLGGSVYCPRQKGGFVAALQPFFLKSSRFGMPANWLCYRLQHFVMDEAVERIVDGESGI